jgi:hypothetical protein
LQWPSMALCSLLKLTGTIIISLDALKHKISLSLRVRRWTAVYNDGTLDKESTSYNDIFDAFRLSLKFYHFEDSSGEFDWPNTFELLAQNYHIKSLYQFWGNISLVIWMRYHPTIWKLT